MSDDLRFIVSYEENFTNVDDEWKWRGDKTTSIVVPTNITVAGLALRLKEKLGIVDPGSKIELKFRVPNLNVPPIEIREHEDLSWYISIHKETAICVTILEVEPPSLGMATDTNWSDRLFFVGDFHQNVHNDEISHQHNISTEIAREVSFFAIGVAPLDENLDDLLNGNDAANIAERIIPVNTSDITKYEIFFSKKELYSKILVLALQEKFEFRVSRSSMKMLTVECADSNCKWMLRALTVKKSALFMIRKFNNQHTYSIDMRRNAHRHATSSVIAKLILGKLDTSNNKYDPAAISRDTEHEFEVKISYNKSRREKVIALLKLHGELGDSFHKLASYYHILREHNPETVNHIQVDGYNRFTYFFLAFGASIRGYLQFLRPVIYIDGSHFKGPYKGTLLLKTAQDANKQIYPLAWGIVDAETNKSWS